MSVRIVFSPKPTPVAVEVMLEAIQDLFARIKSMSPSSKRMTDSNETMVSHTESSGVGNGILKMMKIQVLPELKAEKEIQVPTYENLLHPKP